MPQVAAKSGRCFGALGISAIAHARGALTLGCIARCYLHRRNMRIGGIRLIVFGIVFTPFFNIRRVVAQLFPHHRLRQLQRFQFQGAVGGLVQRFGASFGKMHGKFFRIGVDALQ